MDLPLIDLTSDNNTEITDTVIREFYDDRTIIINSTISEWILEEIIMNILLWNKKDKYIPKEKRNPIKIIIDSEGGSVFVANNLIDVIKCSKTPIYAIGMSMVASAAYSIYICCHKRYAFEHTTFLQHDGSKSVSSSGSKARDFMNFLDRLDELDKQLTLENTNITEEEYDKKVKDEQFSFASEAKEKGIVDYIIGVDVNLDEVL